MRVTRSWMHHYVFEQTGWTQLGFCEQSCCSHMPALTLAAATGYNQKYVDTFQLFAGGAIFGTEVTRSPAIACTGNKSSHIQIYTCTYASGNSLKSTAFYLPLTYTLSHNHKTSKNRHRWNVGSMTRKTRIFTSEMRCSWESCLLDAQPPRISLYFAKTIGNLLKCANL